MGSSGNRQRDNPSAEPAAMAAIQSHMNFLTDVERLHPALKMDVMLHLYDTKYATKIKAAYGARLLQNTKQMFQHDFMSLDELVQQALSPDSIPFAELSQYRF